MTTRSPRPFAWNELNSVRLFGALCFTVLLPCFAAADGTPMHVMMNQPADMQSVVISGQATRSQQLLFTLRMQVGCFGTNLRGVANPLAPNSSVNMKMTGVFGDGGAKTIELNFPASIVTAGGSATIENLEASGTAGIKSAAVGNSITIEFPMTFSASVGSSGNIVENSVSKIDSVSFVQSVPGGGGGSYMGYSGPLTSSVSKSMSSDQKMAYVAAYFPGQYGFCGGYFSPLMAFFDGKRPQFQGRSDFPINPAKLPVYWLEPEAPGAFIALDKNGNGKIDDASELFGDSSQHKNGFEALKELDSNGDGVIDAHDKSFSKLLLWEDRNGDGVSQSGELSPLSRRIISIDLHYKNDQTNSFGNRAEARQRSSFVFKENGRTKKGEVIDIWFSPAN